jgi:hypothetical protein
MIEVVAKEKRDIPGSTVIGSKIPIARQTA